MDFNNLRLNVTCKAPVLHLYENRSMIISHVSEDSNQCVYPPLPITKETRNGFDYYNTSFALYVGTSQEQGLYNLYFNNCPHGSQSAGPPVNVLVEIYETNAGHNFLSAGEMPLPLFYSMASLIFFFCAVLWTYILRRSKQPVYRIHIIMCVLVYLKALSLAFHGINYHFIQTRGEHVTAWAILYYITHLLKGAVLFVTIVLVGTGWNFIKHILSDRDKKLFMIVIPLQVLANVAEIILAESEEGAAEYNAWRDIFVLVELMCCGAIMFPVVWSIRHLQDASSTDGKAAINLRKLKLFRHFYVMVVCYIYFTRFIVSILKMMQTTSAPNAPTELVDATDGTRYRVVERLAQGSFGTWWQVVREGDMSRELAVRAVPRERAEQPQVAARLAAERTLLAPLRDAHILRLHRTFADGAHVYAVMEFRRHGTLAELAARRGALLAPEVRFFVRGLLQGLRYLRARFVFHGALSPRAVYLGDNLHVRIAMSRSIQINIGERSCALEYAAPEVERGETAGPPADVWSLGCIMFQLLVGKLPFSDAEQRARDPPDYRIPARIKTPATRALIAALLQAEPARRPAPADALEHAFFDGLLPLDLPLQCLHRKPPAATLRTRAQRGLHRLPEPVATPLLVIISEPTLLADPRLEGPTSVRRSVEPPATPVNTSYRLPVPLSQIAKTLGLTLTPEAAQPGLDLSSPLPASRPVAGQLPVRQMLCPSLTPQPAPSPAPSPQAPASYGIWPAFSPCPSPAARSPAPFRGVIAGRSPSDALSRRALRALKSRLGDALSKESKRGAGKAALSREHPQVWISRHLNLSQHYGFGYEIADDTIGVLFRDRTSLVASPGQ